MLLLLLQQWIKTCPAIEKQCGFLIPLSSGLIAKWFVGSLVGFSLWSGGFSFCLYRFNLLLLLSQSWIYPPVGHHQVCPWKNLMNLWDSVQSRVLYRSILESLHPPIPIKLSTRTSLLPVKMSKWKPHLPRHLNISLVTQPASMMKRTQATVTHIEVLHFYLCIFYLNVIKA